MDQKPLTLLLLSFTLFLQVTAQNLPDEWRISPDGKQLLIGEMPNTGLYDQTIVKSLYLNFSQPNYWTLLQQNYNSHTDLPASLTVDGILYDSVGVRFKGQTSYSQTMNSQKKSFNITMDYAISGQDLMGYETLNLNNCFQDESFLRETFYLHSIKKYIPAAKSAYVKLYINGANWGVYPNVQQLNKDYYKEWFLSNDGTNIRADKPPGSPGGPGGWGDGTAALNYNGPDSSDYKPYYTLKNTNKPDPWSDLISTCDVLNNTPVSSLSSSLPAVLDVDRTLWFLASEVLFSDDDSYIYKGKMDYYIYWEPETGRITPQEFDGNSVMDPQHQNWSAFYNETNANYPLMNKLFAVPQYRQRYLAHLRTMISEVFDTAGANAIINGYKAQIDTMVQNDPKKLYTYTQFQSEVNVLKNFISIRKNLLNSNAEVAQVAPVITNTAYYTSGNAWTPPVSLQDATVRASATSPSGIFEMNLYYANGLVGNFTKIPMFDDGAHDDGAAADGIYGATIPGQPAGDYVRFYVESSSNNTAKSVRYDPPGAEHNVYVYIVAPAISSDTVVVINEIMASNSSTAMDNAGDYDDWIELYNNGTQPADLSGYILTDNPASINKWTIPPGTILAPNDYLIIWADEDSSQGPLHANFKLSASGESLMLLDAGEALVDSVSWGQQVTDYGYARMPNGTGNFVIQLPTYSANNNATGISETSAAEKQLVVYPNPVSEELTISTGGNETLQVSVYNAQGQRLLEHELHRTAKIKTDGWQPGIYVIKGGARVVRVVKL